MSEVYEMLWDCQFCGTTKLLGKTHRFCPNCGAPQDPKARYFPSDEERIAVKDHVFTGVDKVCPSCNTLNSANSEFCQNCGAPIKEAAGVALVQGDEQAEGLAFESSGSRDVVKERFDAEMMRVGVTKNKNGASNWKWIAAIGGICGLVMVVAFVAFFWKQEKTVVAAGHTWAREIRVDQYVSFTEQSWWNMPPPGDEVFRGLCVQRERSQRQVPDGETCSNQRVDNGDGTFRTERQCQTNYRSEPVYDDWCTFTGKRWQYERSVTTQGDSVSDTPQWGALTLDCNGQRRVGCEREANRVETYNVIYNGEEDIKYTCAFPQNQWEAIKIESVWTVQVRVLDQDSADCESLKQK